MHNLMGILPAKDVEKALGQWVADRVGNDRRQIALDGKTLRASAGADYPALHRLAAYGPPHHTCPLCGTAAASRACRKGSNTSPNTGDAVVAAILQRTE